MRGTKTGALTPGDSLSKIAKRYKTSTDEIAKNNNIKDVSKIFPGQHLTIYGAKTNSPLIYIVVPGDTLAKIAEKNGANVDDIARQNNISDPNKIYLGQSISIRKNGNNTAVESDNSAINPPTSKTVSKKQLQNKEVNSNKKTLESVGGKNSGNPIALLPHDQREASVDGGCIRGGRYSMEMGACKGRRWRNKLP
ncbi:LysM peptidoglycan-binding domain-containing protein [Klebsiella pneumoniae]